ncbi:MAG: aldo/keto reductase, partial [bacterium]|nr:aldo/keto reductase [bacterium]
YSLLERDVEREVIPACEAYGLGMLPFFPLAMGLLTGKVKRETGPPEGSRLSGRREYVTDDKLDRVEALERWGAEHGRSLLEIAIGSLGAQPTVTSVIAGATSPEQVHANVAAGQWIPTSEELAEIDALAPTRRAAR